MFQSSKGGLVILGLIILVVLAALGGGLSISLRLLRLRRQMCTMFSSMHNKVSLLRRRLICLLCQIFRQYLLRTELWQNLRLRYLPQGMKV